VPSWLLQVCLQSNKLCCRSIPPISTSNRFNNNSN
jgi:hypothetical protein